MNPVAPVTRARAAIAPEYPLADTPGRPSAIRGCGHPRLRRATSKLGTVELELLNRELAEAGQPSYRAEQVWEWVARGARGYEEMTNLPEELRERLAERVPLSALNLVAESKADDGTVKALFETREGGGSRASSLT